MIIYEIQKRKSAVYIIGLCSVLMKARSTRDQDLERKQGNSEETTSFRHAGSDFQAVVHRHTPTCHYMRRMSTEEQLLDAYGLQTLDPRSWADSIDMPDSSAPAQQDEDEEGFRLLVEAVNRDANHAGIRDPEDPLCPGKKVTQALRERSITDHDILKFSIGSKQFNSKLFLKFIHKDDSFQELKQSLNYLEQSIEHKNVELKGLIDHEYLRFVRSKSALDGVLQQFQQTGLADEESGLKSLQDGVNHVNKEATLLSKPILINKQKEMKLKQSIDFIEKKKFFFNLPKQLRISIQENDYDSFIHDYKQAEQLKEDENSKIVNRIWEDVQEITDGYKKTLWDSLNKDENDDDFLKTIKKLLELDAIDNPILEWIDLKSQRFTDKLNDTFSRYHEKILNVQLNITTTLDQPDVTNFKAALGNKTHLTDCTIIIEMWLLLSKLFTVLRDQALGFIKFWHHVENFMNGTYQQRLSSNYIDHGRAFLKLERYQVADIKVRGETFIDLFIHKLLRLFNSSQESLKSLHTTQSENTDGAVSSFGFIPPFANSLSTLKYLPNIAGVVSETLNELGQLVVTDKTIASLRDLSVVVNERIVGAVCATWLNDCHNFYKLEDWSKIDSGETFTPTLIYEFESYVVENMGSLLLAKLPEAKEVQIVKYPSKKILTGIQIQFLRSFDVLLESMIKKIILENQDGSVAKDLKDHHKLLTLFNIKKLSKETVPNIVEKYDDVFDTSLRTQKLEIYTILQKMEQTIFDSYMTEQRKHIARIIADGVGAIDWSNVSQVPAKVSAYIYEALGVLITVHTGVLSVSSELIGNVLKDLVAYASQSLLKTFREVTLFSMEALRQLVLDVEFFKTLIGKTASATTLNNLKLIYKNVGSSEADIRDIRAANTDLLREALEASGLNREIFES